MSKIFIERKEATRHPVNAGETLVDFLARMKSVSACDADLTWEELAIYNWATNNAQEVKRALIELVGCPQIVSDAKGRAQVDKTDPEKLVLDPKFGLEKKGWPKEDGKIPMAIRVAKRAKIRVCKKRVAKIRCQTSDWSKR